MKSTLYIFILLFGIPYSLGDGDCEDETTTITVGDIDSYNSCKDAVREWPYYCNPEADQSISKKCCRSCAGVDYTCQDQAKLFRKDDEYLTCQDLVNIPSLVGYCKDPASQVKDVCCRSCARQGLRCVDIPACLQIDPVQACKRCELDTRFQDLCCDTCKKYTTKYCQENYCIDDPYWSYKAPTETIHCVDLRDKYAGLCSDYKSVCCDSCKNIDVKQCRDLPIFQQPLRGVVYTDCSLVEKFPYLCFHPFFFNMKTKNSGYCCGTCNSLREEFDCVDNPLKTFSTERDDSQLYCDERFRVDNCACDKSEFLKYCCKTCQGVDTSHCGCKDRISKDNPKFLMGREVTSCKQLLSREYGYPYYCKEEEYSKQGGLCCATCAYVDTDCVDEPYEILNVVCKELVRRSPYFCKYTSAESPDGYKDRCCHSCRNVDASCTDTPHRHKIDGLERSCPVIAKRFQYLCRPDQLREQCCRSCQNVDTSCTDNPFWRGTVTNKKGEKCENCSCYELRGNTPNRKAACCDESLDASTECCQLCAKVNCDGYKNMK